MGGVSNGFSAMTQRIALLWIGPTSGGRGTVGQECALRRREQSDADVHSVSAAQGVDDVEKRRAVEVVRAERIRVAERTGRVLQRLRERMPVDLSANVRRPCRGLRDLALAENAEQLQQATDLRTPVLQMSTIEKSISCPGKSA